jgi:hypothetical protein
LRRPRYRSGIAGAASATKRPVIFARRAPQHGAASQIAARQRVLRTVRRPRVRRAVPLPAAAGCGDRGAAVGASAGMTVACRVSLARPVRRYAGPPGRHAAARRMPARMQERNEDRYP